MPTMGKTVVVGAPDTASGALPPPGLAGDGCWRDVDCFFGMHVEQMSPVVPLAVLR